MLKVERILLWLIPCLGAQSVRYFSKHIGDVVLNRRGITIITKLRRKVHILGLRGIIFQGAQEALETPFT